jgi:hypothetical protein
MRSLKLVLFGLILSNFAPAQIVQPYRYTHNSFTQNVNIGVGTARVTNSNAYLEVGPVTAANKGMLPPRLSTTERDAIPVTINDYGLFIFNKTTNKLNVYTGSWGEVGGFIPYLDTMFVRNDSLYYKKNGSEYFVKKVQPYGTPTLQQVLTAGATLTTDNTIDGGGNDLSFSNNGTFNASSTAGAITTRFFNNSAYSQVLAGSVAATSDLSVYSDSIILRPALGKLSIDTLNYTLSTAGKKIMLRDTATGLVQNIDPALLAGVNIYNSDGALTANRTVDADSNELVIINSNNFEIYDINSNSRFLVAPTFISLFTSNGGHKDAGITVGEVLNLVGGDSIFIQPYQGKINIDSLRQASNMLNKSVMVWDSLTGRWERIIKDSIATGGGSSPAGNYGGVQLNRNGLFDVAASDSFQFNSGAVLAYGNAGGTKPAFASPDDPTTGIGNITGVDGYGAWVSNGTTVIGLFPNAMVFGNTTPINWGPAASPYGGGADVGIIRAATGMMKVTNASSGWGDIGAKNMIIGSSVTTATSATAALHLYNGTVPSASITDGVLLYSEDAASSAELKVRDEAGNITTLSPHNFTGIPGGKSEDMAWSYYSEKDGKYINADMAKALRTIEYLSAEVERLKQIVEGKSKKPVKLIHTGKVKSK